MADKWPLANGNWSNAANWNGGTLPVDGDVIYADNRTVTIDVDINLPTSSLRTTQRSGGTAGGSFVTTGSRVITIAEAIAGSSHCFVPATAVTFVGTTFRGSATGSLHALLYNGTANLIFVNCTAVGGTGSTNAVGASVQNAAVVSGTLHLMQTTLAQGSAFQIAVASTFTLTGNVQHGLGANTASFSGSGTYTVIAETCIGGTTTNGFKWSIGGASVVSIVRQSPAVFAFPAAWTSGHLFISGASGVVSYSGDIEHCLGGAVMWLANAANCIIRHIGTLYGAPSINAQVFWSSSSSAKLVLDRIARNATSGLMPPLGNGWCFRSDSQIIASTETTPVTLVPASSVGDPPAQSDVRDGVSYHFDTLEGSLIVPIPAHVSIGVETDNTVGTLVAGLNAEQSNQLALLPGIATALAGGAVNAVGRVSTGGRLLVYIGDDWKAARGTSQRIPVADPAGGLFAKLTALTVANLQAGASRGGLAAGVIPITVVGLSQTTVGGVLQCLIEVELSAAGVGLQPSDDYQYHIQQRQGTDDFVEIEGPLFLRPRRVAAS